MKILGISCYYHDAAAALLIDGSLVAAAQEERFTRKRHDQNFPTNAIHYCLQSFGLSPADLDYVVFYDKPFVKFERILHTYIATFPRSIRSFWKALPIWLKEKMWIPQQIRSDLGFEKDIYFAEHHMSHAASAFLVSPFEEAAILTTDGVGEWDTTTLGLGRGTDIQLTHTLHFPHSLGLLYSAFTYYLGFKVNSAEYKVMGLAPYGEPRFAGNILKHLVSVAQDGSFKINMKYFSYDSALTMTDRRFETFFGSPCREPESEVTQFHKDVAASLQSVTDTIMVRMARHLARETGLRKLCLAGGVALNCVSNSKILEETPFDDIFVQPAAGDAGGAVGAACYLYNTVLQQPRSYVMADAFLGPEFSDEDIASFLNRLDVPFEKLSRGDLLSKTARLIAEQKVVGWFQGRMEFGPRALGSRSILADARNPNNQSVVNLKIKFRESFRPFAPTVLEERVSDYFHFDRPSPFMLFVATVREDRRHIPAVTHVDGTARLQTISRTQHPLYFDLLKEFEQQTECPVLINTSFNVRGEPIVCTPADAWKCFMRTEMDVLVLGSYVLEKEIIKRKGVPQIELEKIELD